MFATMLLTSVVTTTFAVVDRTLAGLAQRASLKEAARVEASSGQSALIVNLEVLGTPDELNGLVKDPANLSKLMDRAAAYRAATCKGDEA